MKTALACNAFDFIFLLTKAIKVVNPPPPFPYFFKVTLDNLLSGSCSVWLRFKVLTLSAFISSFFCKILTNIPKTNIQNHQQSHDTTHSKTLHVERYRTKKLNNAKKKIGLLRG